MNPYDPCVWNKDINGKQSTIVFHVDDCKISHVDPKSTTELLTGCARSTRRYLLMGPE